VLQYSSTSTYGVQWKAVLQYSSTYGVQWKAVLQYSSTYGVQWKAVLQYSSTYGVQWKALRVGIETLSKCSPSVCSVFACYCNLRGAPVINERMCLIQGFMRRTSD